MDDRLLEPFLREPGRAGLFFDFDGTLSDTVPVPSEARPVRGARELLSQLAERFRVLAVVSGRSATELVQWLGSEIEIWGVHGTQRAINGRVSLTDRARPFEKSMVAVRDEAQAELERAHLAGVMLEDKTVMVNLHYRNAPDREAARRALEMIAARLAERHDLICVEGRFSVELRPPVEFSKATVVRDRAREERLASAAFFGDDLVDLPGFDALDELEAAGVRGLRVAVAAEETPVELIQRADAIVQGPSGVLELLKRLL